jgi:hypothetical protein
MRAEMYYNDGNLAPGSTSYDYTSSGNLKWMSQSLKPSDIQTGTVNITGLTNGENYIFKLMIVYRNSSNEVITLWSNQTPDKKVVPRQVAPVIEDIDGKNFNDTGTYFVNLIYPANFFYNMNIVHKIIFLLYNNELNPDRTDKVLTAQEFTLDNAAPQTRFLLTDLKNENTYEISCFCSADGFNLSPVSNTILAELSLRPTPPYLPIPEFFYDNGNVRLTTNLSSSGKATVGSFYYTLEILNNTKDSVLHSIPFANITSYDIFSEPPRDFSFNTSDYPSHFIIGEQYNVRFKATSASGTSITSTTNILTFTPMKKASAPVLQVTGINSSSGDISFDWSASTLNGANLYNYIHELRTDPLSAQPSETSETSERSVVSDDLVIGTQYYANVYAQVYNPNYATVVNRSGDYHTIVTSDKLNGLISNQVYATSYVKMNAPALNEHYDEGVVNEEAKYSIVAANNNSGISFEKYQIVQVHDDNTPVSGGIIHDVTSADSLDDVRITGLTNGTPYRFSARSVVRTTSNFSDSTLRGVLIYGDLGPSETIIPWRRPDAPSSDLIEEGNHFITLSLTENNTAATGISVFRHFSFGSFSSDLVEVSHHNVHLAYKTFYNLINDREYTVQPSAVYTDPNTGADIVVQGNSVQGTPSYTASPYVPTNVAVTALATGIINVMWGAPSTTTQVADDKLHLQYYRIYSVLDSVPTLQHDNIPTSLLSKDISGLTPGSLYTIKVEAVYHDDITDGTEVASVSSSGIYPYTPASAPTLVNVTPGNQQLTVDYQAPTELGGRPIRKWRIYYAPGPNFAPLDWEDFEDPDDRTIILSDLNNGTSYKVSLVAFTTNPNTGEELEGVSSPLSILSFVPRPDTIADIKDFQLVRNGFDIQHDVTTGSVELSWTAITAPDLRSIGFVYQLRQINVDSLSAIDVNDISDIEAITTHTYEITDMNGSSYTVSGLPLGAPSIFIINLKVNDPNNSGSFLYGIPSGPVVTYPYDNTPDAVQGTQAVSSNKEVTVSWTSAASIGGQVVTGYNVYQREYTADNSNTYLPIASNITASSYNKTGLSNGTIYQYYVAYVLSSEEVSAFSEYGTIQVTATPFAAPSACVIDTDKNSPVSGQIVISLSHASEADGSPVLGYHLYENGIELTGAPQTGYVTFPVTRDGLNNGDTYSYFAKPVYANLNDGIILEGPASDTVTKIPFKVDIAPVITNIQNIDETHIDVSYSFTADPTTGLVPESKKLYLYVNEVRQEEPVGNSPVRLEVSAGMTQHLKMISSFLNPNYTTVMVNSSYSATRKFRAYSAPSITSLDVLTVGDSKVYIGLLAAGLFPNSSVFKNYIVRTYLAAADGSRLNDIPQAAPVESDDQTTEILISGLTNGTPYRFEATAVGSSDPSLDFSGDNLDLETNSPTFTQATPTAVKVPEIKGYKLINGNTTIQLEVQSYYQALTNILLFVSPSDSSYYPGGASPAQLYYEIGSVAASTADAAGKMYIPIQLNGITPSAVHSIAIIALNDDGKSPTFFYPSPPSNKLSGTYQLN